MTKHTQKPRNTGQPSTCYLCCCNSCNGLKCPWLKDKRYLRWDCNETLFPPRCGICCRHSLGRIYDCDFFSFYRVNRVFAVKKLKKKKRKVDVIIEQLSCIDERLTEIENKI